MTALTRDKWRRWGKKHLTWGRAGIVAIVAVEILWLWFLWRILKVVVDILAWGGEI